MAQLNKLQDVQKQFAAITPDQVKQAFFPDVAQEEANTKTALLAAKTESRRPIIVPAGSVALDADGKAVFKNQPMASVPDAVSNNGRTIQDNVSGKKFKSNGKTWVPQ